MKSASRSHVLTLTGIGPLAALAALLLIAFSFSIIAYPTQTGAQTLSDDATLSALTVSPKNINGFLANRTSYEVGVASTVTQATITATTNHSGASFTITPADSNADTPGHHVALSSGTNTVTITVTAEDTNTTEVYTVNINRGVTDAFGWKADDDFDAPRGSPNDSPTGIWANRQIIWISDRDDTIYAYRRSNQTRYPSRDFNSLNAADNNNSFGIWSDDNTMWVVDSTDQKIYAYRMSNQARDSSKEFNTLAAAENNSPLGIWSDGITMWVSDSADGKLYAYRMSDKHRDPDKDFDTLNAADNTRPSGICEVDPENWTAG